jgi:hypothetical protein
MPESVFALSNSEEEHSNSFYITCPMLDVDGNYAGCEINFDFIKQISSNPIPYPGFFKPPSAHIKSPDPLTSRESQVLKHSVEAGAYLTRFGTNKHWDKKSYYTEAYESFCVKKLLENPNKLKVVFKKVDSRVNASKLRPRVQGRFLSQPSRKLISNAKAKHKKRLTRF